MTPSKQKTEELIEKYKIHTKTWTGSLWVDDISSAVKCALIAVKEMIMELERRGYTPVEWYEVKQHLEQ
jgi:hypothetical protein